MIRFVYGDEMHNYPTLQDTMHRDRAIQFKQRLGWDVAVDEIGWERDEYDALNPLYVIWETPGGRHGGSMRFLPMAGRRMVNDHFSHLADTQIMSPFIWECTRFCLSPDANSRTAALLSVAGGELVRAFGLSHVLGVFDARMVRIYNMIGTAPEVIGSEGHGRDKISVGLWSYRDEDRRRVLRRAGISSEISEAWFERSFGRPIKLSIAA